MQKLPEITSRWVRARRSLPYADNTYAHGNHQENKWKIGRGFPAKSPTYSTLELWERNKESELSFFMLNIIGLLFIHIFHLFTSCLFVLYLIISNSYYRLTVCCGVTSFWRKEAKENWWNRSAMRVGNCTLALKTFRHLFRSGSKVKYVTAEWPRKNMLARKLVEKKKHGDKIQLFRLY